MERTRIGGWADPLAQDYSVVAEVDADTEGAYSYFLSNAFHAPADGPWLAAAPMLRTVRGGQSIPDSQRPCTLVVGRSTDRGRRWTVAARLPFSGIVEAAFVAHANRLYLLIVPRSRDGLILAAESRDHGTTWSDPVEVVRLPVASPHDEASPPRWLCLHQTAMLVQDGRLHLAVSERCQRLAAVVCALSEGVLNPAAWRVSEPVEMPIPRELDAGLFPGPSMRCLEGNVIRVRDRIRVLARAVVDRYATANLAAVYDLVLEGGTPRLTFVQFYPVPGGQCKFYILHDAPSGLYWMASNLPANSQGWVESPAGAPRGDDRRFLTLWYSCDALNWFPAGCIARTGKLTESFMYPSLATDGADLVVLSRTSCAYDGVSAAFRAERGYHDANRLTLHRVERFRELSMDIQPRV